jgi:hypothetical protein
LAEHFGSTAVVSRGVLHDTRGAIAAARRLKWHIPLTGHAGAPVEDEIAFERLIGQPPHARD